MVVSITVILLILMMSGLLTQVAFITVQDSEYRVKMSMKPIVK